MSSGRLRAGGFAWSMLTLATGTAGGGLATLCHLPLGWLLGSLVGAALLCCSFEEAHLPQPWRYAGQLAIGVSAGLAFTPHLLSHVASVLPIVIVAVLASIAVGLISSRLLTRTARIDPTTAYFASVPGGVAEMANLAERHGGDVAAVAIAQTLRIFLAVLIIPPLVRALGHADGIASTGESQALSLPSFLACLVCAVAFAWPLAWRHIPNAWLLGGLITGLGVAIATGVYFGVPGFVLSVAQVLIGTTLGTRLRRKTLFRQARIAVMSMCATGFLLAVNIGFGVLLYRFAHIGLTSAILSTAPGGLAEMGLTAIALHADVGLVVAFHLVRTIMVAVFSVPIYLGVQRLQRRLSGGSRSLGQSW